MLRFFRDLSESRSELLHRSRFDRSGTPCSPPSRRHGRHLVPFRPGEWGSGLLTEVIVPQRDPRFRLQLVQSSSGSLPQAPSCPSFHAAAASWSSVSNEWHSEILRRSGFSGAATLLPGGRGILDSFH
jgi:hypothetical protein